MSNSMQAVPGAAEGARRVASVWWEVRIAIRGLLRGGFATYTSGAMLALGIGVCAAAFSIAYSVVVRPVAWPEAGRLAAVLQTSSEVQRPFTVSPGVFLDWQSRARSFDLFAGIWKRRGTVRFSSHADTVSVARVSADFWELSGMQPVLGRVFGADEDRYGQPGVALIGVAMWRNEFGGRRDVLGRTLLLDGEARTIVGVLPGATGSPLPGDCDVWVPLAADPRARVGGGIAAVGRLRPGVTFKAAQAEMTAVVRQLAGENFIDSKFGVSVQPFGAWVMSDTRSTVLYLAGSAALFWLICCGNAAGLLLMRAAVRSRTMAVRASLGASRFRLASLAIIESALLSAGGGVVGAALASTLVAVAPSMLLWEEQGAGRVAIGITVLFSGAAAVLSALLTATAPVLRYVRAGQRRFSGADLFRSFAGERPHRARHALVAVQFALTLVLLCGAGLLGNSLFRLLSADLGFARPGVLTVEVSLPYDRYNGRQRLEFLRGMAERVRRLPQVRKVSISDHPPLEEVLFPMELRAAGAGANRRCEALRRHVDADYFAVLGTPFLKGRDFGAADEGAKPIPAILNQAAAKVLFGSEEPLGRPLTTSYSSVRNLVVVGVVRDTRQLALRTSPGPQVFLPLPYGSAGHLLVKAEPHDAGRLAQDIRAMAFALDPQLPPPEVGTMDERYWGESRRLRSYLGLLAFFAAAGTLAAAAGIYGVTAEDIEARTREFAIRVAMGARPVQILLLAVRGAIAVAAAGMLAGVLISLAATGLLSSLLFNVRPRDPFTLALSAVSLGTVAVLVAAGLAWRSATMPPSAALRHE